MDLTLFFSAIDETLYGNISSTSSFFKNIRSYTDKIPDFKEAHLALIGLPDADEKAANAIREKLYQLKRGTGVYRIVDLGNLKPGIDREETYTRLSEVCRMLLEQNVFPVLFGGNHDLTIGQYTAYETLDKLISFLNVDAFLDLEDSQTESLEQKHVHRILMHEPNFLFNYIHMAYQTYLIDPLSVAVLEKLYFEAFRLGQMRNNLPEMEPAIRHADLLSFDLTAIRSADAPAQVRAQPFGLTGEEACQLCWYAGHNEKLSSAGFYGYQPALDDANNKTASVVATMIWYLIEGFYHRKNEQNIKSNDFTKYTVPMPAEPASISFYKSKISEKWWMEVPYPQGKEKFSRNSIVPCSYADYQLATRGEVPERYISTLAKLI
jgi:formiminoglutamase